MLLASKNACVCGCVCARARVSVPACVVRVPVCVGGCVMSTSGGPERLSGEEPASPWTQRWLGGEVMSKTEYAPLLGAEFLSAKLELEVRS